MNLISEPDRAREVLTGAPMPTVPRTARSAGIGRRRADIARFCDGVDHRALVVAESAALSPAALGERVGTVEGPVAHVRVLAEAAPAATMPFAIAAGINERS
ncbi:hypothetical protein [Nocardia sp. NPDC052112]|uniref:hypothetical protein n=1 Tax=Nocardia sp. NPDC052112 TaxID=3155646 RepID=UPI00342F1F9E